jgi:hypothetical protein
VLKTSSIVKTFFCQFFKYANSHSYALSLTANFVIVGVCNREKLLTSFCYFPFNLNIFPHSSHPHHLIRIIPKYIHHLNHYLVFSGLFIFVRCFVIRR